MDASASSKTDANTEPKDVYSFFVIDNSAFPTPIKHRHRSVIKYTKLPDYDFDSKGSWSQQGYTLQPRLRRIIALDGPELKTTRSLKSELAIPPEIVTNSSKNRKIVTITEDDESSLHPKFSKDSRKSGVIKSSQKAIETDFKEEKQSSQRTTSRLTNSSKYSKEIKLSAKMNSALNRKEFNYNKPSNRGKYSNNNNLSTSTRSRHSKETIRNNKSGNSFSKTSVSKNLSIPSESEKNVTFTKTKLLENLLTNVSPKKPTEKSRVIKSPLPQNKSKVTVLKEIKSNNKPITIIHVPLDDRCKNQKVIELSNILNPLKKDSSILNSASEAEEIIYKDVSICTDPPPKTINQITEMEDFKLETIYNCEKSTDVQTDLINETFDRLDIPNVTLTKDKIESKDVILHTNSLPNLRIPKVKITPNKEEKKSNDPNLCKSSSYIISRATLTYTTRQKINFHVVGNNDSTCSNQSPSPLAYPMSVVSVLKKEIKNRECSDIIEDNETRKEKDKSDVEYTNCLNELKSLDCSYVFNNNKLMKPSDIISTIRVNNGLLQSDYICEQFQRELNFIDSFFESLQYLESYSLSDKCLKNNKVDSLVRNPALFESGFDVKYAEYDDFLSKLENGANVDDTETMASKSLCLLNLLIRDEQRRAKNLLFVLKMREDALKDFTKSQILWLENKKKHENTDISTLKKKQRGALLKLQYECGEMQRMRKALLTLSEKRKLALMKTKKNIELKLRNNVDVEQIILGKKKLKRTTTADRATVPLKCFDLSSSGCEDSTSRHNNSELALLVPEASATVASVTSAEKSIQTVESVLAERSTDTAAENFVVVDGGYLNILFQNLSLPQIFSSGKQYEVNEEALRNIVNSSNTQYCKLNWNDMVEKFMDQIKNRDLDRSSSPSTARSLVDEFDQYYKGFVDEEKSQIDLSDKENENLSIGNIKNTPEGYGSTIEESSRRGCDSASTMTDDSSDSVLKKTNNPLNHDRSCACDSLEYAKSESKKEMELETASKVTGPLVVPPGAAADPPADTTWPPSNLSAASSVSEVSSVSSAPLCPSVSSVSSLTSPVHVEAEELRRQQLAIEREIKELEQQQSRLLVVREIPDKPPPPYTPPAETRTPKLPRMFMADATTHENIKKHITEADSDFDPTDAFDVFVKDFCQETLERQDLEQSDKPWDACNLLPQKPSVDADKLVKQTSSALTEVLTGVTPPVVSGVSARRSDHIDDILFAEWRRCEPEWTALHTDEALVKNQIFESIFQKILTDTVDEYKKIVRNNSPVE